MLNDLYLGYLIVGHILLQSRQRISPAFILPPDILPFYHCCSCIPSAPALLPIENLPE
jgi:hypothetical protein